MLISRDEIQKSISKKGWNYDDKKLKKSYDFKNFSESIKFINEIANKANSLNHHPEISINFNKVEINPFTSSFKVIFEGLHPHWDYVHRYRMITKKIDEEDD